MKVRLIVLIGLIGLVIGAISFDNRLCAQDVHFSMLDLDPLLFNPAYSGFFDGKGRYGVIYRNQWASVSVPFQTVSATAEMAITRNSHAMNGLSGGLCLTADRAGSLGYGSTSASAIVSFFQGVGDGTNIFSVAAEVGVGQAGFSTGNIMLADATEDIRNTSVIYPTVGAGVAWFWQVSDVLYTKVGVSVRNINEPDVSYFGDVAMSRLSRHLNVYSRAEWRMASNWSILPLLAFQKQQGYSEMLYGCDARFYANDDMENLLAFGAGLMARHGDALSVNLAVLWHEWTFAFCYDANISRLASASHTLGAFELGVVYLMPKPAANRRPALPCPIF